MQRGMESWGRRAWLLLAVALVGCAAGPGHEARVDTPVRPGATLELREPLPLPAADARVYFQAGQVTRFHDRDRFAPWCSIGVRRSADGTLPDAIEPGRFMVVDVRSGARAGRLPGAGVKLASRMAMLDRGGSLGHLTWTVEMRLDSVSQPRVDDLRCAVDRAPDWRGRLGLESIRQALGDLGRISPADD